MTLAKFIRELVTFEGQSESAGQKEVIVIVDGAPMPYPDVVGIEANEDTVVIAASVFGKPKGN